MTKILFVCLGNICRSPSAENVMQHMINEQGVEDQFEIDSAGTIDFHTGKSPDARMIEAARSRGIMISGSARQVKPEDFEYFDWVLAMDEDNYQDLKQVQSRATHPTAKLQKFCEFCREFDAEDVPDPYYGGAEGFELVLDLLEDGCASLLKQTLVQ